jgi:uncharacterized membrane protein
MKKKKKKRVKKCKKSWYKKTKSTVPSETKSRRKSPFGRSAEGAALSNVPDLSNKKNLLHYPVTVIITIPSG